jgi:hypothetical protein
VTDTSQPNVPIPAYKGTIFISYARNDDVKPPFDELAQGWVKFFWEQLRWELTDRGVPQTELWLDRYQIEPAEDFTQKIEAALKDARMIIPILSPNWVQREWCRREVNRFVELHADDGVVPVKKIELTPDILLTLPPSLQNREGYSFYAKDPTGAMREFYWRGLQDKDAYLALIRRIAEWIATRIISNPAPAKAVAVRTGQVVYLALATDELRDARQRVANDLEGAGHVVYPSSALPDTAAGAEAAIRDALAKAVLSVHFVGDHEGAKPDGSDEGMVRLQLRIAREFAGASGPVPRVLWVPKWLPGNRDSKRDPFDALKKFGTLLPGEEVYAGEATDLSQMLRSRLVPQPPVVNAAPNLLVAAAAPVANAVSHLLVAAAAPEDDGLVGPFANRLQSDDIKVRPRFSNDAAPPGNLDRTTAVLVLWGNASQAAIDAMLDAFIASHARVTVLSLPGGDAVAKQRFFRDDVYVEQLAEIPADRKSGRELLVRLEIAPPAKPPP